MDASSRIRGRWPSLWLIALTVIGLYQLALGRRHAEHIAENPIEVLPFVLAGLGVLAAIGLLAGGRFGRVAAAVIAVAGEVWALFAVLTILMATSAFTSLNALGFLAIYLGIAAGYVLVLVRAIRGR